MNVRIETPLRITLVEPPVSVAYAIGKDKGEWVDLRRSTGGDETFGLEVTVNGQLEDGRPRFLGAFTQGPPTERFIYINVGTSAGDHLSCWTRRAKIPLGGITWAMIEEVQSNPGLVIAASFPGRAKDGGPSCATIRPLGTGWTVVGESDGSIIDDDCRTSGLWLPT